MKVVNFFGGPGCGKTTLAGGVFSVLRRQGVKCELVHEAAKDFVWDGRHAKTLKCQPFVFGCQLKDIWVLDGQTDYAIVDSPLLLSAVYSDYYKAGWPASFNKYVRDATASFDNINFFVERENKFDKSGRLQNEKEALYLDDAILAELVYFDFGFTQIGTMTEPSDVAKMILAG